jgi:hypothetical protein
MLCAGTANWRYLFLRFLGAARWPLLAFSLIASAVHFAAN